MTLRNALMGVCLGAYVLASLAGALYIHIDERRNRIEKTNKAIPVKVPLSLGIGTFVVSLFVGFSITNLVYF